VNTADRRAELVAALVAGAGDTLVTDDPRYAIAPCILVHPVPARTYTQAVDGLLVTLTWQVIALAPGGQFDATAARILDDLQEIVEDSLEDVTRILSARVASFAVRSDQHPQLAIITTTED
jgi:hypothetical protein